MMLSVPSSTLVTGAASGIGEAVAAQLVAAGGGVALVDRDSDRLGAVADRLSAVAGRLRSSDAPGRPHVSVHVADVADAAQMQAAIAEADREHAAPGHGDQPPAEGRGLRGIVSAAGVLTPGGLDEVTDAEFHRHLAINTGGVLNCLRGASAHLGEGDAVVVVSSNAARVPRTGMLAYVASKAAASAVARAAGLELAGRGIRCNVVEPGSTDTAMQRDLWPDAEAGARAALAGDPDSYRVGIPLGRIADPADVAATVVFLLSQQARHVTMQRVLVDGGASL